MNTNLMGTPSAIGNGRYQIVQRIGQGGMGAVYEAVDTRLGNQVALKQLTRSSQKLDLAFEREAKLLARLRHSALPVVSDYFVEDGAKYLVMQFIPGDDLAKMLEQRGASFPVPTVLIWADTILGALEYLHQQQPPVIHRDIKPHNLKLTPSGEIVLLDFGIAKGNVGGQQVAQSSVMGYTLHYAPLEQLQQAGTDGRSDLYALGMTLYQLMTNIFLPPSALERATARFQNRPDPLQPAHALQPAIPVAVSAVLQCALALDAAERYASAAEMRKALRQATMAGAPGGYPRPATTEAATGHGGAPNAAHSIPSGKVNTSAAGAPARPVPPALHLAPVATPLAAPKSLTGTTQQVISSRRLFGQWMLMNLLWWLILLGLAFAVGPIVIALAGLAIGITQGIVLRRTIRSFPTSLWIATNSVMGPLAFLIGFLISSPSMPNPPLVLGVISGLGGGAVFGAAQWYVLKRCLTRIPLWIPAQAVAWATIVLLCYVSIGFFALAGLIIGVFSGAVLLYLLQAGQHGMVPASAIHKAP